MMGKKLSVFGAALAAAVALSGPALAGPVITDDPNLAPYTLQYGDFSVVSLQFAGEALKTTTYNVQSGPGQISNDIVLGTSAGVSFANGKISTPMSLAGADSPYDTEGKNFTSWFATGNATSQPHPGPVNQFVGDAANSWNIQVGTLSAALGNQTPVFYFNLNESGSADGLAATDILLWAKVTLAAPDPGNSAGYSQVGKSFYLAGNPFDPNNASCAPAVNCGVQQSIANAAINGGAPDSSLNYGNPPTSGVGNCLNPAFATIGCTFDPNTAGTPQAEEFAYVHGNICVSGSTLVHYGSCTGNEGTTVKQNAGANNAAFAAYSDGLDALLATAAPTDVIQVQWEMADEDNGYEQLFIQGGGPFATTTGVPEPLTLSLFGAGLVGGGVVLRRRRKAQVC